MAGKNEYPLALVIKAIDEATAPLRSIGASVRDLGKQTGLSNLSHSIQHVGHAAREVVSEAGELVKKFLELEVVGGFALYEIVESTVAAGAALAVNSKRVGLTADEYAGLSFAAKQAHISQEEFTASMDQFNKRLGEAKAGGGPLLEFLNKVSPALANQVKHAHTTREAFGLMAKAFEKVTDPAKRAALSAAAFGKGSVQFGQFLGEGNEELQKKADLYLKLAGPQQKFADESEETEKKLNEVGASFQGLRNTMVSAFYPAIMKISAAVTDFMGKHREDLGKWAEETGAKLMAWVDGGGIDRLVKGLEDFAESIGKTVDALGGFKNVAMLVGLYMAGPLIGAVVNLAGALWSVSAASYGAAGAMFGPFFKALVALVPQCTSASEALLAVRMAMNAAPLGAFALAAVGVSAALYEIYQNRQPLKEFFDDMIFDVEQLTLKMMGLKSDKLRDLYLNPFADHSGGAPTVNLPEESRRGYINTQAPAALRAPSAEPAKAEIAINFVGLPKGARPTVTSQDGSVSFDMSMGANLVGY